MAEQEQYVTLGMGEEVFAIPVAHVQEILDLRPVARLPHAPHGLLGLTDVRGQSVAVVELRALLGLQPAEATQLTRILVLELAIAGRSLRLGLLVDRVFEVTGLDADRAEPAPDIGRPWRSDCIRGIGRRAGGFVVVLDVPRLIGAEAGAALMLDAAALAA
jgi:purine-binding chemotaxis protein CheW